MIATRHLLAAILGIAAPLLAGVPAFGAAPAVSAGDQHSIALQADGTLRAWGDDSAGALGTNRSLGRLAPAEVAGLENVAGIAAGSSHTVAVTREGRVFAWGNNGEGQLGDGSRTGRSIPTLVAGVDGVVEVAAGIVHTVARKSDGTVWTWGASYFGQLGGDVPDVIREAPGRVPNIAGVIAISAGMQHTVALTGDGRVWAWGLNQSGQLGDGTIAPSGGSRDTPRVVAGLDDVVAIAAGWEHTLALRRDGTVWAWGYNADGSLGDGTTVTRGTPAMVSGLAGIVRISAGTYSAAVRNDGSVWVWGANGYGQLGDGTYTDRPRPLQLPITGVAAVSAGFLHSAAVRSDGGVYMWGSNNYGQLGDGTRAQHETPMLLPGVTGITRVALGEYYTVALTAAGRVLAWGDDRAGQLGDGVRIFRTTPATPAAAASFTAVAAGARYSLALASDGRVFASGNNEFAQLGDGTQTARATFAPVSELTGVAQIAAGTYHALARKTDGSVWAWGAQFMGRLGTGPDFTYPLVPVRIPGLANVVSISAGFGHSLALLSDGTVRAWGENFAGQVGDGTTTERYVPVAVAGLSNVVEVAAGYDHSLARLADGTVMAWGGNNAGQLGDGTQADRLTPVRAALPARATGIFAGSGSGALTTDGGVWRWGANYDGQLGVGDNDDYVVPLRLAAFGDVRVLSVGGAHTLALRADGSVFAWGRSDFGQVGDGTLASRFTPVAVSRENGAGSVAGNDWFLDLDPAIPTTIPVDKVPSFLVVASATASTVTADIRYRAQDVGTTASTFVFALAPVTAVHSAKSADERIRTRAKRSGKASKADGVQCALAQLNAQGQLVGVSTASMQAYVSGVLSAQGQSVNILNTTNPNVAGATFYVGYGANGNAMLVNGTTRSVVSVPGNVSCFPQAPQTGWWYNPAEGGRGFSIESRGNRLFMAAFHYDASGRATWNFAGGATSLDGSLFTGDFLAASGGQTLTGAYRLPGLSTAGPITLAFSDDTHGTMFWPGGSTPIERQAFVPNGLGADPQANLPESGWWWNPQESGRGFFIEWQNGYVDLAGYMYDDAGNPTWYITVVPTPNPLAITGNWWTFSGGQSMGGPYRPATRTSDNAGSVAIEFSGPTTATLTLPGGRQIPLVRQAF